MADDQQTQTWMFTFGHGQRLRSTSRMGHIGQTGDLYRLPLGLPLYNRYVVIPAASYAEARDLMVAIFGDVWSFDQLPWRAAGVDEYGLVELDITEALAELGRDGRVTR